MAKVNFTNNETHLKQVPLCDIPAKDTHLESNHEETLDKAKQKDILQSKWPVIFKRVKVIKVKEKLRHDSRLKKTIETRQQSAIRDSELDPFTIKDTNGTTGKT